MGCTIASLGQVQQYCTSAQHGAHLRRLQQAGALQASCCLSWHHCLLRCACTAKLCFAKFSYGSSNATIIVADVSLWLFITPKTQPSGFIPNVAMLQTVARL
jgi:hypothetical protein